MPTTKTDVIKAERDLTFANLSEDDRLRRDIYRSDKEKFLLLVQMFRNNALYKRAKVTHKP
ncbi:hypothetical protein [uncultured Mucilaginibacter sp.]|uniref:hypothetical protein n=1 Tax=uncultured Mucilaginibacter sp. TaxID=797541 RepID=UPI0025FCDD02|nr:hypothetical protein [uncultured Mucilaginibacter sp.]